MTSSVEATAIIARHLGIEPGRADFVRRELVARRLIGVANGKDIPAVSLRDTWMIVLALILPGPVNTLEPHLRVFTTLLRSGLPWRALPDEIRYGPLTAIDGLLAYSDGGRVQGGSFVRIIANDPQVEIHLKDGFEPFVYHGESKSRSEMSTGYRNVHELHSLVLNRIFDEVL